MDSSIEPIKFLSTKMLEELLHQMQVDTERFSEDILEIEQELIIRKMPFCRPVIDLV